MSVSPRVREPDKISLTTPSGNCSRRALFIRGATRAVVRLRPPPCAVMSPPRAQRAPMMPAFGGASTLPLSDSSHACETSCGIVWHRCAQIPVWRLARPVDTCRHRGLFTCCTESASTRADARRSRIPSHRDLLVVASRVRAPTAFVLHSATGRWENVAAVPFFERGNRTL